MLEFSSMVLPAPSPYLKDFSEWELVKLGLGISKPQGRTKSQQAAVPNTIQIHLCVSEKCTKRLLWNCFIGTASLGRLPVHDRLLPRTTPHHAEVDIRQEVPQVDGNAVEQRAYHNLALPRTHCFHNATGHVLWTHSAFYRLVSHYHTTPASIIKALISLTSRPDLAVLGLFSQSGPAIHLNQTGPPHLQIPQCLIQIQFCSEVTRACLQCFDTDGWAAGRPSGL